LFGLALQSCILPKRVFVLQNTVKDILQSKNYALNAGFSAVEKQTAIDGISKKPMLNL
jgi:hypothetical protein